MNVTVFLSSRDGKNPLYKKASTHLGARLAQSGHTLVYGGSKEGCMGAISDAALLHHGRVIAVYPDGFLPLEPPRQNASQLYLTKSMDERKRNLIDLGDAFVVMPGGFGTMEEAFQLLTEMAINQTRIRPVIFVGKTFYSSLSHFIQLQLKEGMLSSEVASAMHFVDNIEETINLLGENHLEQAI